MEKAEEEEQDEDEIQRPLPSVEESLFKSNITHEIEDINKKTENKSPQPGT